MVKYVVKAMLNLNDFIELPSINVTLNYYAASQIVLNSLNGSCDRDYRSLNQVVYHACGNGGGVHIGNFDTLVSCEFNNNL